MMGANYQPNKAATGMTELTPVAGTVRDDVWSSHLLMVAEKRDQYAFTQLFEHFAPMLKGFYASNMANRGSVEIEELVQEVMCKVWLKASSFNASKSAASTWIYTIARNTRIDHLRKNMKQDSKTQTLETEDIWDEGSDHQPFVYLNQARDKASVNKMLTQLPLEQRECLSKMYMEGKSHSELADELGLPLGTVKSRIRLGLKRLQSWLPNQEEH